MSGFGFGKRKDLFDGSSGQSSTYTGSAQLISDFASMSLSIITVTTEASRFTVEGSNDDGYAAAITNWSTLTALTAQGLYTIDPGARWMRVLRSSLESTATVQLNGWAS